MVSQFVTQVLFGLIPMDGLPDPSAGAPPAVVAVTSQVFAVMKWGGMALAVLALIAAVAAFAWRNFRGDGGGELATRLLGVAGLVLVSSSAVSIVGWINA